MNGTTGGWTTTVTTDYLGRASLGIVPLPSGDYTVSAYFDGTFTLQPSNTTITLNDGTYVGSSASVPFQITKTTATLTFDPASLTSQSYDGTPKSVTVTTSPAGLSTTVTYNGLATAPTNAGTYAVVATVNDPTYQGSATGQFTINKAAATLAFNTASLTQAYDGNPKPVKVTTSPAGLDTVTVTYNGSTTAPSSVGTYALAASLANSNYVAAPITGTLTISRQVAYAAFSGTPLTPVGRAPTLTATIYQPLGGTLFNFRNSGVTVTFNVYAAGCTATCATTPVFTSKAIAVSNTSTWPTDGTGSASVVGPKTLAEGAYLLTMTVSSSGSLVILNGTSTFAIGTSNGQYINGGGTISPDSTSNYATGSRLLAASFAFNIKSGNSGPSGSLIYAYRMLVDTSASGATPVSCATPSSTCRDVDFIIRSSPVGNYVPGQSTSYPFNVYGTGQAVLQGIDVQNGAVYAKYARTGTYRFDVTDSGSGGTTDKFGTSMYASDGTVIHQAVSGTLPQSGISVPTNRGALASGDINLKSAK